MQTVTVWLAGRVELRITSMEVPMEYRLAGILAHSEVFQGRVEGFNFRVEAQPSEMSFVR